MKSRDSILIHLKKFVLAYESFVSSIVQRTIFFPVVQNENNSKNIAFVIHMRNSFIVIELIVFIENTRNEGRILFHFQRYVESLWRYNCCQNNSNQDI